MKLRKIVSMALAMIMAAALAVPALADTSTEQTKQLEGAAKAVSVDITVDSNVAKLVFNPYQITLKVADSGAEDTAADSTAATSRDQIISKTLKITNKTNVPMTMIATLGLEVKAAQSATPATIMKAAPADNATAKQVFVYADFAVFDSTENNLRDDCWLSDSRLIGIQGAYTAGSGTAAATVTGAKHTDKNAIRIPEASSSTPNYIYVKLGGAATKKPTTAWDANDLINVAYAFSFTCESTTPKRSIILTKPNASNKVVPFGSDDSGKLPTMKVTYQNNAVTATAVGGAYNADSWVDNEYIWYTDADATPVKQAAKHVAGNVYGGYTIILEPAADSTTPTKKYAITAITALNEDGSANSAVKPTKLDSKSKTTAWSITMPDANIQLCLTIDSTAS